MGQYLNPGTNAFRGSLISEIYVDKSGLIKRTNAVLGSRQKYMCISRPRRFGKSMAMEMLAAYYGCKEDSRELFDQLEIAKDATYEKHINKYNVLQINIQEFLSSLKRTGRKINAEMLIEKINKSILTDLFRAYGDISYRNKTDLVQVMYDIYEENNRPFVILIDEWDCIFREYQKDTEAQKLYLDFLRGLLKDQAYVALAYMTGILPIKKYGTHSALNMFTEYSMTTPRELAPYFGFTDEEARELCAKYRMDFDECKSWYDGYKLTENTMNGTIHYSMYSPKSVVDSMTVRKFGTYWNSTENYEALKIYIEMNMDGLKDAIIRMLAGESVRINIGTFANDMTSFATKDDILTLLVHLGYLRYDEDTEMVSIPNKEVYKEYYNAISTMDWSEVAHALQASRDLMQSLWDMNGEAVAAGIDKAHNEISILQYNNENSLSCAINLAFYCAREYYNIFRELPSGKGFADICFVPRPLHMDKPAIVVELKWDRDAQGAIAQIRNKQYVDSLKDFHGNLLLAGINYDKESKTHSCAIEKLQY